MKSCHYIVLLIVFTVSSLAASASGDCVVELRKPRGPFMTQGSFILLITNVTQKPVSVLYATSAIPVSLTLRIDGMNIPLLNRHSGEFYHYYSTKLFSQYILDSRTCLSFYINAFQSYVAGHNEGYTSLGRLVKGKSAELIVRCTFGCPEANECSFTIRIRKGKLVVDSYKPFLARATRNWSTGAVTTEIKGGAALYARSPDDWR